MLNGRFIFLIRNFFPDCSNKFFLFVFVAIVLFSCKEKESLFTVLSSSRTGVDFTNHVTDSDTLNILDYLYFYNGGGVAIGDMNNDGLPDLYFSSNLGSNKLYLNKGSFHFEDITQAAGVQGTGNWKTGVTMADVNGDGWLDIYVSEVGKYKNLRGRNELFINNGASADGKISFTEKAKEYGLDAEGFNTQATFFDYDHDGDLDMFLVNHSVHSTETYRDTSERSVYSDVSGDKLFRQEKINGQPFFTEVSKEAGIISSALGYGLNVIAGDFNNDGWDDLYVSNDFHENDYYYINNQNGTFSEKNREAFGHESRFSMGSDAGDVNGDGWLDVVTLDMLPSDEKVLKSSVGDDPLDIYDFKTSKGYHHQYARNCLQLNVDGGKRYSDIALFAGVSATDWSWSPLLADFNNDGITDLFVANGISRRPNDLDFVKFMTAGYHVKNGESDKQAIAQMPVGKIRNEMFEGTTSLQFIDRSADWGFGDPTLSNGAAYADLDGDGDLDIVVNNVNAPAGIYQNNTFDQLKNHSLTVQLQGDGANKKGYGAKVILKNRDSIQLQYITATRGFESSSDAMAHFGLGDKKFADTVQVIWPDGKMQMLTNIAADKKIVVHQKDAQQGDLSFLPSQTFSTQPLFVDITDSLKLDFRHEENHYVDFNVQPLIPHEVSTEGPKLAVADVNGDGLDDFFVCGGKGQGGSLFQQTTSGKFIRTNEALLHCDTACENVNAVFFDADGDGDKDLYVVSGGNESVGNDSTLLDHLYLNDGKGIFKRSNNLPLIYENKSVAVAADFDRDGDLDLFIGGRVVGKKYGEIPSSHLLLNNGKGVFTLANESVAPGLQHIGMVTDATWTDIDKDGWLDLVVVGEWMPITVFKNQKGVLQNSTRQLALENTAGLWSAILATDLDNDGYDDLLVGNYGLNSKLSASKEKPLQLYVGDIDNNGSEDQVLTIAKEKGDYPFLGKEELEKVLPALIKKNYLDYKSMAGQTLTDIMGNKLANLKKRTVTTLASVVLKNKGGRFTLSPLPAPLEWSPVFSFLADDVNKDGKTDILCSGNFYGVTPYEGRYDASYGNVILQDNNGWKIPTPLQSGFILDGEIRDMKKLKTAGSRIIYAIARNNKSIVFYKTPTK